MSRNHKALRSWLRRSPAKTDCVDLCFRLMGLTKCNLLKLPELKQVIDAEGISNQSLVSSPPASSSLRCPLTAIPLHPSTPSYSSLFVLFTSNIEGPSGGLSRASQVRRTLKDLLAGPEIWVLSLEESQTQRQNT
ncbi:hypothetical protein E2C01_085548 [Portunus trituberculatus]|uniref:Uncharacterized protein n=1 Tax=Portunus trituberculatus TaxID=210409 RepID=A0A5B7J750_PORTR|nr:hypothetical protein [Portunus trituberculatus]